MLEISAELRAIYNAKAEKSISLSTAKYDLETQLVLITPAEGWPGKNAEERKLNADRGASADKAVQELRTIIRERENELTAIQAGIDSLEAERRALEWEVRGALAFALSGKREESDTPVEYGAFDDVLDNAALELPF
jgi:hypothetical protein